MRKACRRMLISSMIRINSRFQGGCQPPGKQNADGSCSCSSPSWCDDHPNGGCSRWGLCKVVEAGGGGYCAHGLYPCLGGKSYHGRGPKQVRKACSRVLISSLVRIS